MVQTRPFGRRWEWSMRCLEMRSGTQDTLAEMTRSLPRLGEDLKKIENPKLALLASLQLTNEKQDTSYLDAIVSKHAYTEAEIASIKPDLYRMARSSKAIRDKLTEMKSQVPALSPEALSELENNSFLTLVREEKKNLRPAEARSETLRQQLIARLQTFSAMKEKQSEQLAAAGGEQISPEFKGFFDAAMRGDGQYVTNKFEYYRQNHPQYSHTNASDASLRTSYWGPVLEICLAYNAVVAGEPEYMRQFGEGIIQSIPAGSIYFGGTDPGRGLVTAFCRSQPEADPFFTLTQNALADPSYLDYLRRMYGGRIYVPTAEDSQMTFENFYKDIQKRLAANQLKPGEQVTNDEGRIQIAGQVVVMEINAELAKIIIDRNPGREFYLEESFPLDWMYPYLEPHGLILKINRAALPALSAASCATRPGLLADAHRANDWRLAAPETSLKTVLDFVEKTYVRKDLSGFTGNPRFIQDEDSQKMFSKLRSTIAGVYAWRVGALKVVPTPGEYVAPPGAERQRMSKAADLAFRQAFALCPYSPEIVFRYAGFLAAQGRKEDAISVLETGLRCATGCARPNRQDAC